jgi:hypothetical protein
VVEFQDGYDVCHRPLSCEVEEVVGVAGNPVTTGIEIEEDEVGVAGDPVTRGIEIEEDEIGVAGGGEDTTILAGDCVGVEVGVTD